MVGMTMSWLAHVRLIEIWFPMVGHLFLLSQGLKSHENPEGYLNVFNEIGLVVNMIRKVLYKEI